MKCKSGRVYKSYINVYKAFLKDQLKDLKYYRRVHDPNCMCGLEVVVCALKL